MNSLDTRDQQKVYVLQDPFGLAYGVLSTLWSFSNASFYTRERTQIMTKIVTTQSQPKQIDRPQLCAPKVSIDSSSQFKSAF